jgi:hypothetical protein
LNNTLQFDFFVNFIECVFSTERITHGRFEKGEIFEWVRLTAAHILYDSVAMDRRRHSSRVRGAGRTATVLLSAIEKPKGGGEKQWERVHSAASASAVHRHHSQELPSATTRCVRSVSGT